MAYLTGFENDIFISYSHVDDQDGWIDVFQKKLEMELSRQLGEMGVVRVWRDRRRIQGNHLFDKTIQNAINSSALFVAPPRSKSGNGKFKLPFLPVYEFDNRDLADSQTFMRVFG